MEFDGVLLKVGGYGRYQKILCVCLAFMLAECYCNIVGLVLILVVPNFTCNWSNLTENAVTVHGNISQFNSLSDQCEMSINGTKIYCTQWLYDSTDFDETLVTKFNWICSHSGYRSYAMMSLMVGMLVGSFIGPVGDIIGRKKTIYGWLIIHLIVGLCVQLTRGFITYAAMQTILAVAMVPFLSSAYTLGAECLIKKKRMMVNVVGAVTGALSFLALVGASYFLRHWRYIQLLMTLPSALLLPTWWITTESPRWLVTRGRKNDAEIALKHIARINRIKIKENLLNDIYIHKPDKPSDDRLWHMFCDLRLCIKTLTLLFIWVIDCMVFYGLTFTAGNLSGNIYINCLFCAVAELPSVFIIFFSVNRLGRKPLFMLGLLTAGTMCISSVFTVTFTESGMPTLTLALMTVGKVGGVMAFTMIYMYSMEYYPTSIRATAMGLSIMTGRVGCIIAPYIANMTDFLQGNSGDIARRILFGGFAVIAGLLIITLPETSKTILPESIEDCIYRNKEKEHTIETKTEDTDTATEKT